MWCPCLKFVYQMLVLLDWYLHIRLTQTSERFGQFHTMQFVTNIQLFLPHLTLVLQLSMMHKFCHTLWFWSARPPNIRDGRRPKNGCFFWKVPKGGGGGVISDPKNHIADFVGFKAVYFGKKAQCNFQKGGRGGGSLPIQKISLQIYAYLTDFLEKNASNFQKRTGGQGRLEVFQKNINFWTDGRP